MKRKAADKKDTKQQALSMSDTSTHRKPAIQRHIPLVVILAVALVGAFTLRDYLSFETLASNRDALVAYRDANLFLAAALFVLAYIVIVAFSLPGATIATLTGGFLFGTVLGTFFNVFGATIGATLIFLAARHGFGDTLAARMETSEGTVKKIKDGIDANQWPTFADRFLDSIHHRFVPNVHRNHPRLGDVDRADLVDRRALPIGLNRDRL